jgi:preprotein translocase, YajC subunit
MVEPTATLENSAIETAPAAVEAAASIETIAPAPAAPETAAAETAAQIDTIASASETTAGTILSTKPNEAAPPPASPMMQFLPLILIFAIFYFLLIRPSQRKEKERKKEIQQLRSGTKILFGGGMLGVVTEVKEFTFMVKIAESVTVEIARGAVQRIIPADNPSAAIAEETR